MESFIVIEVLTPEIRFGCNHLCLKILWRTIRQGEAPDGPLKPKMSGSLGRSPTKEKSNRPATFGQNAACRTEESMLSFFHP
jgi:hypothetical protein